MKPPDDVRREFVRQWLRKARGDLLTAEHLASERPDLGFAAAFHAQQAVEKALKALLVWHQVDFPKSHDLERLVELLDESGIPVERVLRQVTSLTLYAVDARYPGDLPEPTVAEVEQAVAIAHRACASIAAGLPDEFREASDA